ncbi:MAG: class B sortase [Lachnospiraceae bacterium]|nr:class B sortase [Lachnospiraceae bacterium]
MRKVLHRIFFLIFLGALAGLLWYGVNGWRQQHKYAVLREHLEQEQERAMEEEGVSRTRFEILQEINPDVKAYIEIPETKLSYPVMQSSLEDGNWYLMRDIYGDWDYYGTPFADIRCDMEAPSRNLWIYGHNMSSGRMFGSLRNYRKKSYFEEHPKIEFECEEGVKTYEVAAVIELDISQPEDAELFLFVDPQTEEAYEGYLEEIRKRCIYATGVELTAEDYLISLTTCGRLEAGTPRRLVVVGRLL